MRSSTSPDHRARVRVLLADHTGISGQLLTNILRRDKHLAIADATAEPIEVLAAVHKPHVAVISAQLEGVPRKGFEVLARLRASFPETRVVMLLDCSRRELVIEAFRGGARGVFCRSDPLEMLPKCVRCVGSNQVWASAPQLEYVLEALAEAPATNLLGAKGEALLSKREQDVVRYLAEGLGNREIAKELQLSQHTVKNYLFRIFNKLGVSSRLELVLYAASQKGSSKRVA